MNLVQRFKILLNICWEIWRRRHEEKHNTIFDALTCFSAILSLQEKQSKLFLKIEIISKIGLDFIWNLYLQKFCMYQ